MDEFERRGLAIGASLHDIGKMEKSEYYVENQRPEFNKHDELSPSMSALVIAAHVKDGMELGRKWRLPQMVIDFIPEHHGTGMTLAFYRMAVKEAGDDGESMPEGDFQYPGPKPQSRETAITMLADSCEARVRSAEPSSVEQIEEIIADTIKSRLDSGQLDESDLTLRDLHDIARAFSRSSSA